MFASSVTRLSHKLMSYASFGSHNFTQVQSAASRILWNASTPVTTVKRLYTPLPTETYLFLLRK